MFLSDHTTPSRRNRAAHHRPLRALPVPGSPRSPGDLERELKYIVPAGRMPFVQRWLAAICRQDPAYAVSDVWSVYYDTPDRLSLREKLNSDYLKTKIRVRWYQPGGDAFLELKRRVGDRRDKVRVVLAGGAAALAGRPLDDAAWLQLLDRFRDDGVQVEGLWRPVVSLVYRRLRFVDAASLARISCDSAIRAAGVPRRWQAGWSRAPLPVGVIEIKGQSDELPASLAPVVRFGGRAASFSKYAAVWAQLDPRSV
jgi:hypothetical protein